jgi:hypothetical protein
MIIMILYTVVPHTSYAIQFLTTEVFGLLCFTWGPGCVLASEASVEILKWRRVVFNTLVPCFQDVGKFQLVS